MVKNVDYYMSLPYTRELIPEPGGIWFVRIKELEGCMSQGSTAEEALRMIEDAMSGWLEVELESGSPIPEPKEDEEYSGKFVVRVPKSLHRKLAGAAEDDGMSLNAWVVSALAEAVGAKVMAARPGYSTGVFRSGTPVGKVAEPRPEDYPSREQPD